MVKRRVGQHDAQCVTARRNFWSYRTFGTLGKEHYGASVGLEQRCLALIHLAETASGPGVEYHQSERLGLTLLSLPQALHSLSVERVTGEMVASQPLDGQDCSCGESSCRRCNRVCIPRIQLR